MYYSKQEAIFCTAGFGSNGAEALVGAVGVCESVRQWAVSCLL